MYLVKIQLLQIKEIYKKADQEEMIEIQNFLEIHKEMKEEIMEIMIGFVQNVIMTILDGGKDVTNVLHLKAETELKIIKEEMKGKIMEIMIGFVQNVIMTILDGEKDVTNVPHQNPEEIILEEGQEGITIDLGDQEGITIDLEGQEGIMNALEDQEEIMNALEDQEGIMNALEDQEGIMNALEDQEGIVKIKVKLVNLEIEHRKEFAENQELISEIEN